ncbi:GntR family transcriptional regulator [Streptomyces virginiae]|uniref:GntR family transcriptional regulator n=1 Tax=Streptomyces virginiae TaxID=1961 RepID=UPI003864B766|nr:GntR family transcriptional regulator [Streptomyces virginiae]
MPSRRHIIAEDLRRQIAAGHFEAGERLPSEARLATLYAVSTPTLRSALALLQGEGLVDKIHGSGNFVRRHRHKVMYIGGKGAAAPWATASAPLRVSVRATNLPAHGHLTDLLNVQPQSPLTEFLVVTHEGKLPHSLAHLYVPRDLVPADLASGSPLPEEVAMRLAQLRPPLAQVEEKVSARLPTAEETRALRIGASLAVLSITRVATDTAGRVVEASLLVLPSDRADALFTTRSMAEERTSTT